MKLSTFLLSVFFTMLALHLVVHTLAWLIGI